jgi:hypothetical protein
VEGTSTVHRSLLSIARRLAPAATLLVALGIFTGTAHAEALNATVHIQGAGRLFVPKEVKAACTSRPDATLNESVTDCGSTPGVTIACAGSVEKCGALDLAADAADGWSFVGWATDPAIKTCSGRVRDCHVESTAKAPLNVDVTAVFRESVSATLTTQTTPFTNTTTASFAYTLSGPAGSTFECKLDGVTKPCGTIANNAASSSFDQLQDTPSPHTFAVNALTPNGNRSDIRTFSWTVDTIAPTATLDPTAGPGQGALQTIDSETFRFSSSEPTGATFTCSLDNAAFTACTSPTTLTNLASSAHSFRVQAIDQAGNVSTPAERNWTVAIPDADTDGFNAKVDCNDSDPTVHPGANDVADNGKDENCDGADAHIPPPTATQTTVSAASPEQIQVVLSFGFKSTKRTTKFTKLQLKNIPFGATVSATCKGSSCPKALKGKGFVKKHAFGTINLKRFVKQPLKKSTTITVIVSKPGAINAIKVLKIRSAKAPTVTTRCQPPGTKKPVSC